MTYLDGDTACVTHEISTRQPAAVIEAGRPWFTWPAVTPGRWVPGDRVVIRPRGGGEFWGAVDGVCVTTGRVDISLAPGPPVLPEPPAL